MRIPGFEAAQERGKHRRRGHMFLETSLADILRPGNGLVRRTGPRDEMIFVRRTGQQRHFAAFAASQKRGYQSQIGGNSKQQRSTNGRPHDDVRQG